MPKQIIIAEQHHTAAIFSENLIEEIVVSTGNQQIGDIFLGVVENVIPGIDAAFVNIGDAERNGFIHVTDLGPLRLKRSSGAITELVAPQQKALVQVMKEPTGNKGPRLTGNISLPGRYLVLMPYGRGVNLSRQINKESERSRLRALAILVKPAGMGLLVRTEAEGQPEEAIMEDLEALKQQWESIQQAANTASPPALLNRDDDFIQRVLRDIYTNQVNRIVVDSNAGVKRVKQQLASWNGGRIPNGVLIDHHRERQPILEYFRVNAAIREALKPRVDLPSGGYIIIEPTEALTVIDVNSGSFTRSATSRETVLWTNCEAAVEIARQLLLRKIGGVIIVDFIDMDSRQDQMKVLESFEQALKKDKARPQISQLSELGLIELTRKRQGQSLYEIFGQTCPTCGGLGHLVHLPGEQEAVAAVPVAGIPAAPRIPAKEPQEIADFTPIEAKTPETDTPLVNHPSYQESGGDNTNRRRRRRSIDVPTKGDRAEGDKSVKLKGNNGTKDSDKGSNKGDKDNKEIKTKGRSGARPPQREEPKQTVKVEMTPWEQEIYALMGLSPLVRLDEEVDPRKTRVYAVEPQEGNQEQGTTEEIDTSVNEGNGHQQEKEKSPESMVSHNSDAIETTESSSVSETSPETEAAESFAMAAENDSSQSEQQEQEPQKVVRRRRRRSSAR
ncbi:Rne/Rng family ribonuclease [Euhalothece natronophila Z-M001]|uniref:Rne/Rng family ribonuclease n=1 Tax=Euhalothece natronophila Z-M001 TaxID=522448 RepID=A0A5B8NP22_9CHRO|nr:Rne/Rng family ribonuclease [Euhalothece natronophila]QDZ39940.1 Rne/Rng family ribonuclease [Euhalothece natronophila Z-M001]